MTIQWTLGALFCSERLKSEEVGSRFAQGETQLKWDHHPMTGPLERCGTSKGPLLEAQRRTSMKRRLTSVLSSAIMIAMVMRMNKQYTAAHIQY